MYIKVVEVNRDLNLSCEGQLNWCEIECNWLGGGVNECSTSVGSDCNMVGK